jgi:hypothetical protein
MSRRGGNKKYSNVMYWRYIFVPLVILCLIFGLYILFTYPEEQAANYSSVVSFTDRFILGPAQSSMNIKNTM